MVWIHNWFSSWCFSQTCQRLLQSTGSQHVLPFIQVSPLCHWVKTYIMKLLVFPYWLSKLYGASPSPKSNNVPVCLHPPQFGCLNMSISAHRHSFLPDWIPLYIIVPSDHLPDTLEKEPTLHTFGGSYDLLCVFYTVSMCHSYAAVMCAPCR